MKKLLRHPVIRKLLAAWERYGQRHGAQHAAAITYFSVLTVIPVLMLFGAVTGFILTVVRPDWLDVVRSTVSDVLGSSAMSAQVIGTLDTALASWRGLGLTALLTASYTGSGWIGNLRIGFCAMMRAEEAESQLQQQNFLTALLRNLVVFFGLLLCLLLALATTIIGTAFADQLGLLGGLARLLLTVLVSWIMFAFLFITLPEERLPLRFWATGALGGAVLVTVLHQFAGLVLGAFSRNPTAAVFGNVIAIMLVLNLVAMIMLLTSAWTGVRHDWSGEEAPDTEQIEDGTTQEVAMAVPEVRSWAEKRRRERLAATLGADELRIENFDPTRVPQADAEQQVPETVAARGVRIGMRLGYGVGAATGLGIGALVAAFLGWLRRR
ncbi:YihY/virulence factor BrkB family protein [Arachnia propionica]|uniref:YihY/virulence factor BrkB family protein n=1 Tax=Arachnia propionica TaxID=1750 RepID=A0A3P1TF19_9ACTN|nr:YihY/virulence factor BrkB family protein [Arachnia propionica]MDO5083710.1 YihY/virulence factor BrkB family protein [Arachnia propionica]RRD07133.1 YihY/virulence factor BrkB family protein [Arachnia propionica]